MRYQKFELVTDCKSTVKVYEVVIQGDDGEILDRVEVIDPVKMYAGDKFILHLEIEGVLVTRAILEVT